MLRARPQARDSLTGKVVRRELLAFLVELITTRLLLSGAFMANRAIWNIRRRHEWLAKPAKSSKLTRRGRLRVGLQAVLDRKAEDASKDTKLSAPTARFRAVLTRLNRVIRTRNNPAS
jgi:hypothetical protein